VSRLEPPYATDRAGMRALIESAPDQIDAALAQAVERPWSLPAGMPDLLAVGAMGGSAIGADLAAAFEAETLPLPVVMVRDARWPACVTRRSLAALASYSGTTAETLALDAQAREHGVPRVALTSGGTLAERCAAETLFRWTLPPGLPPRAALWSTWPAWSFLLRALGARTDPAAGWREAARLLERRRAAWGPDVPEAQNLAKRIARALHDRFPLLYAASERVGPVALRWRHQLHENAKLLGHSALAPELDHNEIVGWERPGPLSGRSIAVFLRDPEDAPETALRLALTREFVERQGTPALEVSEPEGGRLSRLAALVYLGDWVSFYVAMLNGVDPTPIASIAALKRRLEEEERTERAR
jgi:glucose/mannose-6-phosphate isomerase